MDDPVVQAAMVTLIGGLGAAVIALLGSVLWLWRRDPVNGKNGVLAEVTRAVREMAVATERGNSLHQDYMRRLEEFDERNQKQHEGIVKHLEQLTDIVAPRAVGGQRKSKSF